MTQALHHTIDRDDITRCDLCNIQTTGRTFQNFENTVCEDCYDTSPRCNYCGQITRERQSTLFKNVHHYSNNGNGTFRFARHSGWMCMGCIAAHVNEGEIVYSVLPKRTYTLPEVAHHLQRGIDKMKRLINNKLSA